MSGTETGAIVNGVADGSRPSVPNSLRPFLDTAGSGVLNNVAPVMRGIGAFGDVSTGLAWGDGSSDTAKHWEKIAEDLGLAEGSGDDHEGAPTCSA